MNAITMINRSLKKPVLSPHRDTADEVRYAIFKALIEQAFKSVSLETSCSMQAVVMRYVKGGTTASRVKSWQDGRALPNTNEEIKAIAVDAIRIGHRDEKWLRSYLSQLGLDRQPNEIREYLYDVLEKAIATGHVRPIKPSSANGVFHLQFTNGLSAPAIYVRDNHPIRYALEALTLEMNRPVIVIIGGADGLSEERTGRLSNLFEKIIVPICEELQVSVIDGGTDSGVMRLIGQARTRLKATFPLIGIVAKGTLQLEEDSPRVRSKAAPPEPNHSHFLLVPGADWSDESKWISAISSEISLTQSTITIVANGGEITWQDIAFSFTAGHPVIAIKGSGRAADSLAAAIEARGRNARAKAFDEQGFLQVADLNKPEELTRLMLKMLCERNS